MIAKGKRLILSVCLAAVMAVSFVVGVFLMLLPYGAAAEGARHKLELSQDLRAKAEGISYDVSFEFASSGWFANSVPTTEDITMSWTSTAEEAEAREVGELYGIVRTTAAVNKDLVYDYGSLGYNGAYNGGTETFTKAGTSTTIEYSKALTADRTAQGLATGGVYYNDSLLELAFYPVAAAYTSFQAADDAGAQYLGVQWINGAGKKYSASLTDVSIRSASGMDLGVQISDAALSSSVQRYGTEGAQITVFPEQKSGKEFTGLLATPAEGEAYALDITDNRDGSYTFTMPAQDVTVSASYADRYQLNFGSEAVSTTVIDNISYDVSFDFRDGGGWFGNDLPSSEDITMSWVGVSEERTGSAAPGEVYGLVRAVEDSNPHMLQSTPNAALRFTFNATTNTYTLPGEGVVIAYSKDLVAGGTESVYFNGFAGRYTFHPLIPTATFAAADAAGAQYLAVQWLAGTYKASLTGVKIYDANGVDLGIQFGEYTLSSSSVQRYGAAGQKVTVRLAEEGAGQAFVGWQATGTDGSPADVTFTDNKDGTWSFVMPAEDIAITPQYEEYDEVMHKLDIEGGSTVTIGGIAYNVTFESATHGWFANALPTAEDITMSWESMEESVTPRGEVNSGELYGLARIAAASDANYVYNSDANGAMAYNGAYNGGSETFTKEGTSTVIEYSKSLTAERAAEELATGAVYYNGQIMEMAFYKGSFKAADDAGAQYLAVQWLNGEGEENGRPYSATLRNVKIFDADGNDLGIQFSSNLKRTDVQRMGHEGSTITVRAAEKAGYVLVGWQAQGADGSPADVTFTDNKDGTWSFVMPAEDIAIAPQYEDLFASMYALDIEGGSTAKIDGVGYDVSFLYETNGWFANSIPTDGDVAMSWTSIAEEAETRDVGEIYGVARAVTATDANYLFYSGLNGAAGYNGAYNGGAETFTHVGTTTLSYSKELTAERAAQGLATEAVYLNGQLLELAVYPPENPPRSFKAADDAGARYFGVQWINGENVGKTYSATLKNVKIYTPEGEDLGILFSSGATELSVQRKAEAGKTITVRPDTRSGFAFTGWKATDAEGNAVALTFTDNKDGTWSFTMPAQAIRLESQYEYVMYQLNLEGARTTKIEGVSYDVSFEFAESGWFGNAVPSLEDITMSWTGVSQERAGDLVPGHVYGLVRSVSDVDRQLLFNSETAAALRFVYNGTYGTFTDPGADTTIAYSRSLVAGGTENVYYNGSASTYVFNSYGGRTWAAADAAGAQYLAVQWIGGTYKASLSNVKIYDAQGNDLGIQFGEYTLRSSSVQRYGEAGKTLTVAPEIPENYELDFWTVTDAEGNPYELEMTDNGDGTWSFVMPEQGLRIKANFKYTVVESDYYGWYYNIATGSMVQLKEDGVAEITENGQKRNATYAIPYVTELQITDGEETQSYALTVGKFEAEGSVWYRLGTVYVSFETETDAAPARQELKDGNYTAVKPADPVREGYTFGGWYTSDGEEFDFASTVYESVTLHALWIADEEPAAGGCASSAGGPALLASAVLFAGTALIIRRRKEKND